MELPTGHDSDDFPRRLIARARQFFQEMAPKETDSTEVRVAKEILRWSSVLTGAAVSAVFVLEAGRSAWGVEGD